MIDREKEVQKFASLGYSMRDISRITQIGIYHLLTSLKAAYDRGVQEFYKKTLSHE